MDDNFDIDEGIDLKKSRFVLYPPINKKDLRNTYPELEEITSFKNLNKLEMYFVYYFCSFFGTVPNNVERIKQSVYYTWGDSLEKEVRDEYLKGNFPEKVRYAIKRWEDIDIPARLNANMAINKAYDNIITMISVDASQSLDEDDKKSYISMVKNSMELLPKLMEMKENAFGINEKAVKELKLTNVLSAWHSNKKDR